MTLTPEQRAAWAAVARPSTAAIAAPEPEPATESSDAPGVDLSGVVTLLTGDSLQVLSGLPDSSVDAVVTDPPYELGFMGKGWDASGVANNADLWREVLRVLKPGGHLLSFGGTRTYHRMTCAVEDAGFEIRDCIMWLYGSGFPKSHDVSKAIDKAARGVPHGGSDPTSPHHGQYRTTTTEGKRWEGDSGQGYGAGGSRFLAATATERTTAPDTPVTEAQNAAVADAPPKITRVAIAEAWAGWGTALKPAHEPIVVARKPLVGTVASNVLEHGTGALNIDGCRVEGAPVAAHRQTGGSAGRTSGKWCSPYEIGDATKTPANTSGRWPANVILDEEAGEVLDGQTGESTSRKGKPRGTDKKGMFANSEFNRVGAEYDDKGGASRFFYCAKANRKERDAGLDDKNVHPTVKPATLMRYLVRLVTPPGGLVLDPFMGSGSTGVAAVSEGFRFVGVDLTPEYVEIARQRIRHAQEETT